MRINPVVLLVLVNVLVIGFGGVLAFSDLNNRTYSTNYSFNYAGCFG